MFFEVRLTAHKLGSSKPDFEDEHRRMESVGFRRFTFSGNQPVHTLTGMYRYYGTLLTTTKSMVVSLIEEAFHGYPWQISFSVLECVEESNYNLKPYTSGFSPAALGAIAPLGRQRTGAEILRDAIYNASSAKPQSALSAYIAAIPPIK